MNRQSGKVNRQNSVSWSGFKSNVQKELAASFFKVRLWSQMELLEQLFANYDRFDDDLKAELPLKRSGLWQRRKKNRFVRPAHFLVQRKAVTFQMKSSNRGCYCISYCNFGRVLWTFLDCLKLTNGARNRNRTGTLVLPKRRILSPLCLPISPPGRDGVMSKCAGRWACRAAAHYTVMPVTVSETWLLASVGSSVFLDTAFNIPIMRTSFFAGIAQLVERYLAKV